MMTLCGRGNDRESTGQVVKELVGNADIATWDRARFQRQPHVVPGHAGGQFPRRHRWRNRDQPAAGPGDDSLEPGPVLAVAGATQLDLKRVPHQRQRGEQEFQPPTRPDGLREPVQAQRIVRRPRHVWGALLAGIGHHDRCGDAIGPGQRACHRLRTGQPIISASQDRRLQPRQLRRRPPPPLLHRKITGEPVLKINTDAAAVMEQLFRDPQARLSMHDGQVRRHATRFRELFRHAVAEQGRREPAVEREMSPCPPAFRPLHPPTFPGVAAAEVKRGEKD